MALVLGEGPALTDLARRHLPALGCTVQTAASALEGLRVLLRTPPTVTLVADRLPDMGPLELARIVRDHEQATHSRHVPIVVVNTTVGAPARGFPAEAGIDAFLPDVLSFDTVAATLSRWIVPLAHGAEPAGSDVDEKPLDLVYALERLGGNLALLSKLAASYLTTFPHNRANLRSAMAAHDAQIAANVAHKLRGTVGMFGASRAVGLLGRLEDSVKRGDWTTAQTCWSRFDVDAEHMLEALRALQPNPPIQA